MAWTKTKTTILFLGQRTKIAIFCKNIETKLLYLQGHEMCSYGKFMEGTKTSDNGHYKDKKPRKRTLKGLKKSLHL